MATAAAAAVGGEVKVLGFWPSPFVLRPRIALKLKGVEYEYVSETFGQKSELLLKSNPVYKKIPVLIHDGRPVSESMIIVNYIDDVWPSAPQLLPSDPYDRAVQRFWTIYLDDKLFPSLTGAMRAQTEEAKAEALEQLQVALKLLEEAFEKCSKGKPYYGGDEIGYLDIAFGSMLGWIKAQQKMAGIAFLDQEKTPLLTAWAERFCAHEAVKDVMPEPEKLIEFAQMLRSKAPPAK